MRLSFCLTYRHSILFLLFIIATTRIAHVLRLYFCLKRARSVGTDRHPSQVRRLLSGPKVTRFVVGVFAGLATERTFPRVRHVLVDVARELRTQSLDASRMRYFITNLETRKTNI